ncbi:MAG TPA: ArgE/DapE family deacylase [Chloroflexota bacterium]|jgi:acetylornithine deacetylase/succinyl-diaminopimelate desuccinylase family protein
MWENLSADEQRLLAALDAQAEELYGLLAALVRAPSVNPPGDTRAPVAVARDWLAARGIVAEVLGSAPERPSMIARCAFGEAGQAGPRLLFLSHLDTVPLGDATGWTVDPFGAVVRDGRMWGRGAADAKGSAAPMLLALSALAAAAPPLRGSLAVALVADEETGGAGAQYLLDRGALTAHGVVVGETTNNEVAIAEKGVAWLRLVTRGRTAHASVPHAGVNAAAQLVRWLARVEQNVATRLPERRHPLVSPPSLSLSTLAGGVASNVVPDRAEAVVDRPTLPGETLVGARAEILAEAAPLQADDPAIQPAVEVMVWAEPFETAPDAAIVRAALAARRTLGLSAAPVGYQQASDGRFFGARGVPTLVLGPGVAEGTHVPDESVPLAQVVEAAKLYALTALRYLAAAGPGTSPPGARPD